MKWRSMTLGCGAFFRLIKVYYPCLRQKRTFWRWNFDSTLYSLCNATQQLIVTQNLNKQTKTFLISSKKLSSSNTKKKYPLNITKSRWKVVKKLTGQSLVGVISHESKWIVSNQAPVAPCLIGESWLMILHPLDSSVVSPWFLVGEYESSLSRRRRRRRRPGAFRLPAHKCLSRPRSADEWFCFRLWLYFKFNILYLWCKQIPSHPNPLTEQGSGNASAL